MTPEERRGRIYVILFIAALALFDLGVKGLLALQGTLRIPQIGGTLVTLLTLWFLWRGSKFAYWFLVVCLALAAVTVAMAFYGLSNLIVAIGIAVIAILCLALSAPATRTFLNRQRTGNVV